MSFNSPYNNPSGNSFDKDPVSNNYSPVPPSYTNSSSAGAVQPTGRTSGMSIAGFILSLIFPLIGLIFSALAWKEAAKTGDNKGLAIAGTVIGSLFTVGGIVFGLLFFVALGSAATATTY